MTDRLSGRTALITGSTSGIGRAIAVAMAAEGAYVIVTGRDAERGKEVVSAIGDRAEFLVADLSAGGAAVDQLVEQAGQVDILVNNAAFFPFATPLTEEMVDTAFDVSVKAPILLTNAIAPAMAARGGGAIVNVGSINGEVGMRGAAVYGATKGALHSLTKSWAADYGRSGVRVNTVAPGPTSTKGNEAKSERVQQLVADIPSGRMSTPEEVAAAAVFLASDDASNIHGATLFVDGGFTTL